MLQRVVLHEIKGRERGLIMVTPSPIAKGILSLSFDYSLTVKQGALKELLLRQHNGPPSLPDIRLWGDLFHTVLMMVSMCFANRVFVLACVCIGICSGVWLCVYTNTSETGILHAGHEVSVCLALSVLTLEIWGTYSTEKAARIKKKMQAVVWQLLCLFSILWCQSLCDSLYNCVVYF